MPKSVFCKNTLLFKTEITPSKRKLVFKRKRKVKKIFLSER